MQSPGRLPRRSGISVWKNLQVNLGQGVPPGKTLRNTSSEGEGDSSRRLHLDPGMRPSCTPGEGWSSPASGSGPGPCPALQTWGLPPPRSQRYHFTSKRGLAHILKAPSSLRSLRRLVEESESAVTSPRAPVTLLRLNHIRSLS